MLYFKLKFNDILTINEFVRAADKLSSRIDVETSTIVINGSSLLSLVATALEGPVTVVLEDRKEHEWFAKKLVEDFGAIKKDYIE